MHAILWDKNNNSLKAASDLRGSGSAIVEVVQQDRVNKRKR
jgi:hypothetical protein